MPIPMSNDKLAIQDTAASAPLRFGYRSDVGRVRSQNEDSCAAFGPDELRAPVDGLFVVADGMGGMGGGDVASRIVVQTVPEGVRQQLDGVAPDAETARAALSAAIQLANQSVFAQRSERPEQRQMGSTCVAALIAGGALTVANVGDSRAYLLRHGRLWQLTEDHSSVQEEVNAGRMTRAEAQRSRYRNIVTRGIGLGAEVAADTVTQPLEAGDTMLLCSDGLTTEASEVQIARVLASEPDAQIACDQLIEAAIRHGGSDNVTAIVVRYGPFHPMPVQDGEEDEPTTDPATSWRDTAPAGPSLNSPYTAAEAVGWRVSTLLLLALAVGEGVLLAWLLAARRPKPRAAAQVPATRSTVVYGSARAVTKKLFRPDVLAAEPGGTALVMTRDNHLVRVHPDGTIDASLPNNLVSGSAAASSHGAAPVLATDASGNRYQFEGGARGIVKYSSAGTEIGEKIGKGDLGQPTRIAVAPAGDIFVLDHGVLKHIDAMLESPAAAAPANPQAPHLNP